MGLIDLKLSRCRLLVFALPVLLLFFYKSDASFPVLWGAIAQSRIKTSPVLPSGPSTTVYRGESQTSPSIRHLNFFFRIFRRKNPSELIKGKWSYMDIVAVSPVWGMMCITVFLSDGKFASGKKDV